MMTTDVNWVRVLQHHAERTPDQVLAAFGDQRATYADMERSVRKAAAGLQARDVGPGDVVALLSYNSIETLTVQFAANYLGAIVMPLNWRLAAAELEFILGHADARVLLCDPDLIELADARRQAWASWSASPFRPRTSRAGSGSTTSTTPPAPRDTGPPPRATCSGLCTRRERRAAPRAS
jgi:fatty-acyl-CoA synthase